MRAGFGSLAPNVNNKRSMENTELKHILIAYKSTNIRLQQAHDEILRLFSVSGQSELLRAYFKWHKEQGYVSHKDSDIDEFIASNCH